MTTALQIQDFNFYGDNLIALKDNTTGEIYTAINSVLKGIGFNDEAIRYQRNKWTKDKSVAKGVLKFNIPSAGGGQEAYCINTRKLPIALAKINITQRLERDYPDITEKLELYQDKCAEVLASVFIDGQPVGFDPQIINTITNMCSVLTSSLSAMQQQNSSMMDMMTTFVESNTKSKKYQSPSYPAWLNKVNPQINEIRSYYYPEDKKYTRTYSLLYKEFNDSYGRDYLSQLVDDFCFNNGYESAYTMSVIAHNPEARDLMESVINNIITKINEENTEESETNDTK